ncbi:MAG TPA: universal stress protein [Capsulimonadaceae bacterium]
MFETILLCVDESEHSLKAAKYALEMATKYDAEVVCLNVNQASLPLLDSSAFAASPKGNAYRQELREAQEHVHDVVLNVFRESNLRVRFRGEVGQPVSVIVSVAEQERANLIILGSRGTGGFKALLMGSVSLGVLHHAPCPVLVVR